LWRDFCGGVSPAVLLCVESKIKTQAGRRRHNSYFSRLQLSENILKGWKELIGG
jgi:hypothetical protein